MKESLKMGYFNCCFTPSFGIHYCVFWHRDVAFLTEPPAGPESPRALALSRLRRRGRPAPAEADGAQRCREDRGPHGNASPRIVRKPHARGFSDRLPNHHRSRT